MRGNERYRKQMNRELLFGDKGTLRLLGSAQDISGRLTFFTDDAFRASDLFVKRDDVSPCLVWFVL